MHNVVGSTFFEKQLLSVKLILIPLLRELTEEEKMLGSLL